MLFEMWDWIQNLKRNVLSFDLKTRKTCWFAEKVVLQWAINYQMHQTEASKGSRCGEGGAGGGRWLCSCPAQKLAKACDTFRVLSPRPCTSPSNENPPERVLSLTSHCPFFLNVNAKQGRDGHKSLTLIVCFLCASVATLLLHLHWHPRAALRGRLHAKARPPPQIRITAWGQIKYGVALAAILPHFLALSKLLF